MALPTPEPASIVEHETPLIDDQAKKAEDYEKAKKDALNGVAPEPKKT